MTLKPSTKTGYSAGALVLALATYFLNDRLGLGVPEEVITAAGGLAVLIIQWLVPATSGTYVDRERIRAAVEQLGPFASRAERREAERIVRADATR